MNSMMMHGISSFLFALCRPAVFLCLAAAASPSAEAQETPVDVELVLAVDVSWSMDFHEQLIERDGYAAAFRSQEVINAIANGGYGRVAVTYVEWAGEGSQLVVVPWTLIDSAESSAAFAGKLTATEPGPMRRTSISGAIDFSRTLFDNNGFKGLRRVIDISGDGPNNEGRPVTDARDEAVASGLTINGLPLMTNEGPDAFAFGIPNLDDYYAHCVIGGGQAFVVPVTSWEAFPDAVRRKLVLELAGTKPSMLPATASGRDRPPVIAIQATSKPSTDAVDCLIGERMWQRRQGIFNGNP